MSCSLFHFVITDTFPLMWSNFSLMFVPNSCLFLFLIITQGVIPIHIGLQSIPKGRRLKKDMKLVRRQRSLGMILYVCLTLKHSLNSLIPCLLEENSGEKSFFFFFLATNQLVFYASIRILKVNHILCTTLNLNMSFQHITVEYFL